jgi:ABC-type multidrug transport system ATPase subunit/serine/threonine protein kinase
MTPAMFGPYRIERLISRGGMGEVYRAFDTGQNRVVALKCLLPHLAADQEYAARFRRESELAARLREPHVIPIHRYGQIDGRLFIDMRLVEGDDLASVLTQRGPLEPRRAVNVIGQVAAALEAAHDDGLIHRDVKPSNVLVATSQSLGDTDFVYLVDFGIARPVGGAGGLTTAGSAIGSVDYMAPERFENGMVDHRADIYSLGCLLFECLTGNKPFVGAEPYAVIASHMNQPPPKPSVARPGTPTGFDDVVARAMAKKPGDRYASVAELAHAARAAMAAPVAAQSTAAKPSAWWEKKADNQPQQAVTSPPGQAAQSTPRQGFDWNNVRSVAAQKPAAPVAASPKVVAPKPVPAPPGQNPAGWWERKATAIHQVAAAVRVLIGRAPECNIVLSDELVSPQHAELRQVAGHWQIADLGSWNGTYVNGRRITQETITTQDVIGIGHALLRLEGGTLVEYTDDGDISFSASDLVVTRSGKRLLDGVSFALPQRCVLAVVGPSGAGKSTLLGALTGQRPADSGQVNYAGRDLYEALDELRERIGLVPQDDILHPQLTVRRALRYAAELRFPADTPAADRDRRVDEVITELGLTGQASQRISTLSGGQRKRTSVALELLTRPSLLFLDEPTSGLDPGMDKSVMQTLRGLADGGRTVVVVTHSPAQLDLCDRVLVLASGGRLAYFGPPSEALRYFGQADFADMFLLLDRDRNVDWTKKFRESPEYARYVTPSAAPARPHAPQQPPPQKQLTPRRRQQPVFRQFAVLCRRYFAVIVADRAYAIFLLALPLVLSLFGKILPGDAGLSWPTAKSSPSLQDDPRQLLLLLVLGCAFMGFAASFREVVKERAIYQREQAIGLVPGAYLASKLAVLGLIGAFQAAIVGVLGTVNTPAPDDPALLGDGITEIVVALIAVTISIMALGLLVSAVIANPDRGMPIMVVVLLMQLLLCGMLFQIHGTPILEQVSWLMPARWGYAMGAATAGLPGMPGTDADPLWEPDAWPIGLGVQVALIVVFTASALFFLRKRSNQR